MSAAAPVVRSVPGARVQSVDALRGLVMIIMALDHTRDFFHSGAMSFQPDDLERTTAALFMTRWITHVCAPVFAFTAGIGAYFWNERARDNSRLGRFLLSRGLWLVLLDITVVRFAFHFSLTSGPVILNVLWALGWSMVVLAAAARLPTRALAAVSIGTVCLHNLLDRIPASAFGPAAWFWKILHQPDTILIGELIVVPGYSLLPWAAVMMAGYCFGGIVAMDSPERRRWLVRFGVGLTAAFIFLRLLNGYGDPRPWNPESDVFAVLSFLRTTKYPPSLQFLLMTLGPAMLVWAWLDRVQLQQWNPLVVFGRVPLFYFVAHLFLLHVLLYPFTLMSYGTVAFLRNPLPSLGGSAALYPAGFGYNLAVVYAVWILVVVLLYPICAWMARVKQRSRKWWLGYV